MLQVGFLSHGLLRIYAWGRRFLCPSSDRLVILVFKMQPCYSRQFVHPSYHRNKALLVVVFRSLKMLEKLMVQQLQIGQKGKKQPSGIEVKVMESSL